ncbi:MAG: hypothetical protein OXB97_04625 [Rhodospirillales bacterium]|nr:hypothetical protein [Rhodospirillales bacterium]
MFDGLDVSTANVLLASALGGLGTLLALAIRAIANLRHRVSKIEGRMEARNISESLAHVHERVDEIQGQVSGVSGQLTQQNERLSDLVSTNQTLIETLISRRNQQ